MFIKLDWGTLIINRILCSQRLKQQISWKEKDEQSTTFAGIEMSREEKNQIDFENKNYFISEVKGAPRIWSYC